MRKLLPIILFFFAGIAVAEIPSAQLKAAAEAVNQKAPMMVDSDTRLDGASSGNNNLRYQYTLINYTKAQLDPNAFVANLKPSLVQATCTSMKIFYQNGVSVTFAYNDKDQQQISAVSILPKDCGF